MSKLQPGRSVATRFWQLASWPLLLVPLALAWYAGLALLGERVEQRRVVDAAAFAGGFSPIRFDFTSRLQLIGTEVQGGRFTPATTGTTVVTPAQIEVESTGVYFGLRFEGRTLDVGVFRELLLLADASCPAALRVLLDGSEGDAAWISSAVSLPESATVGWGQGLPVTVLDLGTLNWYPRASADGVPPVPLATLPAMQHALRLHVSAAPGCVLRLESLGLAADGPLSVTGPDATRTIKAWTGAGPARHAVEASWASAPQRLLTLEPTLPGAAVLRQAAGYAAPAASVFAGLAVLLCFLRRRATAAASLLMAVAVLNLTPAGVTPTTGLVLIGLAAVLLAWESRAATIWRAPHGLLALTLAAALGVSLLAGERPAEDLRYLGFALLQQSVLLWVLWPALAKLTAGTRIRLLAAGFALVHLPNFELSLLCLSGGLLALAWYQRRGDALSIVLAHALVGLWLGRSDGYGWLWGLETGWRWLG